MRPEPAGILKLLVLPCLFVGAVMGCQSPATLPAGPDTPSVRTAAPRTAAPTPTPLPPHRIGVRVVDGSAEFFDRQTGARFVPRGSNYIRLAQQRSPCQATGGYYHSTFNPGAYNAEQAASALQAMAAQGYNTVRVFLTPGCITGAYGKLSAEYLRNVADLLRLAEADGIVVLFATDSVPHIGYYERVPHYANIDWPNRSFMAQEGVDAEKRFWQDLIRGLADLDAPLRNVLGYSLRNEMFYENSWSTRRLHPGRASSSSRSKPFPAHPGFHGERSKSFRRAGISVAVACCTQGRHGSCLPGSLTPVPAMTTRAGELTRE